MFLVALICFATALLLSFALTWVVRDQAISRGVVAVPASLRHIHVRPVPRIGGVAIYLAIATTLAGAFLLDRLGLLPVAVRWEWVLAVFVPATLVFGLGFYDDLRGVGPYTKFGVQALAAVLLYAGGPRIVHLPALFGTGDLGWLFSLALTVFWMLLITNAFNLIDGVDGLAAGSALFSTVAVLLVSAIGQNAHGLVVTAVLSGALLGFLRFNFNPATIFLGDSGSLLVGFILGAFALQGQKTPTVVAVAIPVISCGLPMLETTLSVLRRFLSGKPIFHADREHIHHKLLKRGLSQRQVVFILYGASAIFGLLSLILLLPGGGPAALVLIVLGGIVWLAVQHLGYHEFVELRRVAQRTIDQKQVIINNLAIRRGVEQFPDCETLDQVQSVLLGVFEKNDFDGLEIRYSLRGEPYRKVFPPAGHSFRFAWSRPGEMAPVVWTFEIDLSSPVADGAISLRRRRCQRPLMVDVNLLGNDFLAALEITLRRLLVPQSSELHQAVSPGPQVVPQVGTARAQSVGTA